MRGEFKCANGFTIYQAKKIFEYEFGEFFLKAEKNDEKLRFDAYVKDKILDENGRILKLKDHVNLQRFTNFWNLSPSNPAFNILIVDVPIKQSGR